MKGSAGSTSRLLVGAKQAVLVLFILPGLLTLVFASSALSWKPAAPSPQKRTESQGAAVNGKLYVFGGYVSYSPCCTAAVRSDVYDPATNKWERIADMPEALTHSSAVVVGDEIWLIGGFVGNHPGPSTTNVWKYDTATNTWRQGPSLPLRRGAGAAAKVGSEIYYFGGVDRPAGKNLYIDEEEHWALDLDDPNPTWAERAPLPNPRNHLAGVSLGGKVYAVGGQHEYDEGSGNQAEVDVYDPATNTWERVADLPTPRGHISSSTFAKDGRILVVGGTVNGGSHGQPSAEVAEYDPLANAWTTLTPLPAGRKSPVADGLADGLVVSATGGSPGPTTTTWIGSLTKDEPPDTEAPKPPTVALAPASDGGVSDSDGVTNDPTPTFVGAAEPGSTVGVYDGTALLGTTAADGAGAWSYTSGALSDGEHTVTAKATNAAGNTSASSAGLKVTIDTATPAARAPVEGMVEGSQLGTSAVPVELGWSGTDALSGISKYELQQSTDGGAYAAVNLSSATATTVGLKLSPDKSHRFRVRAQDRAGNVGGWIEGPSFTLDAFQEDVAPVAYPSGAWKRVALSGAYGGYVKHAAAKGAVARVSFTGKEVAWVAPKNINRGQAEVWVDGTREATVDLYAASGQARRVVFEKAWAATGTHELEVRVLGAKNNSSSGRRVDVDAFVVLR